MECVGRQLQSYGRLPALVWRPSVVACLFIVSLLITLTSSRLHPQVGPARASACLSTLSAGHGSQRRRRKYGVFSIQRIPRCSLFRLSLAPLSQADAAPVPSAQHELSTMGYHTTATQVIQARPDLSGQVAVVTGGSSGIGVETVRALASAGIDCVLCCRNVEAGQRVAAELQPEAVGKITVQCLDLCDLSSVHAAATQLAAQLPRLDMLVLNAGVMAPRAVDGKPQRTADGFELQFGTNHLSHFYLCKLLLPKMKASGSAGRVVVVSSSAYAFGRIDLEDPNYTSRTYRPWDGYNQSKLANRLFVHELARRLKEEGSAVKAFSVHPGIIKTSIGDHIGFRASCFYALAGPFLKSPSQGAATSVFGAVSKELDDKSGAHLQDCAVVRVAQRGRDDAVAAALWSKSEELVLAAMQRRCIE